MKFLAFGALALVGSLAFTGAAIWASSPNLFLAAAGCLCLLFAALS